MAEPAQAIPIAPSLQPMRVPLERATVDARTLVLSGLAMFLALLAAGVALVLTRLIALVTNLAFFHSGSLTLRSPAENHLGAGVLLVPVIGGLAVGMMARFGSPAIRGHGIPEAMEQVLLNQSRIPARITWLKPVSAAIAIGTGGPFGAEGPIIATGGALGSLLGQLLRTTASERKILLAAGAAAGMTATFGSPVAAVFLALELLLFELSPRSLIPVALACSVAAGARIAWGGAAPAFPMVSLVQPGGEALAFYGVLGVLAGVASVGVTRLVYFVEDLFERLPIHWMWWPAIGGLAVGICGLVVPRTLGVGYDNIEAVLDNGIAGRALGLLVFFKLVSWSLSLGSGTSGGTLAPLFTIGGGLGALLGAIAADAIPSAGIDPRIAALVGMAAMFAGASRALLTSVVFAFETTRQPLGLLPLLAGCSSAYLVSCALMKHSIMTEKIERRGVRVPSSQAIDFLEMIRAGARCTRELIALRSDDRLSQAREFLGSSAPGHAHQGFPILDEQGLLLGIATRSELLDPARAADLCVRDLLAHRACAVCFEDSTLREAADLMVRERVGRLPVVNRAEPRRVLGILSRSDLLGAHAQRLDEVHQTSISLPVLQWRR